MTLKARKTGGDEGFLILFRNPTRNTELTWNVGGWGNTHHGLQEVLGVQPRTIARVEGSVESGRWYDVKVELSGTLVKCYLDGELIQTADVPGPTAERFFASAVLDEQANEGVLKVVNAEPEPAEIEIHMPGAEVGGMGRAVVLSGENLNDVNTLDDPFLLYPAERMVHGVNSMFTQVFEPYSFTVLRVPLAR